MLNLYLNLLQLTKEGNSFYLKDEVFDGITYRIFGYRHCTYSDWCRDDSTECRGTMFEMDGDAPTRIASRPMEKFFNLNENPHTMGLEASDVARVMEKVDGSLISTFMHNNDVHFKTKGTILSDQAKDAYIFLRQQNVDFRLEVFYAVRAGYTVNFEWTAPNNRIVLKHQEAKLTVLNVRHNESGLYMSVKQIKEEYPLLWKRFVFGVCTDNMSEYQRQVMLNPACIKELEGIEGYIWVMNSGQMVKLKTDWYLSIHKAKEGALNFNYVFDAVLNDKGDDLRAALVEDPHALELLNKVENLVIPAMNDAYAKAHNFMHDWHMLSRKDYAIKAQAEIPDVFGMAMSAYSGKGIDAKGWAEKRKDKFKVLVNPIVKEE